MRGKNILWLCLIAMFANVMFVSSYSQEVPVPALKILPEDIPASGLGQPGDVYDMAVVVENVVNLWTVGFEIHIRPYASVLSASFFREGGFLDTGGDSPDDDWPPPEADPWSEYTELAVNIDAMNGIIYVAATRIEAFDLWTGEPLPRVGATGSGTIMTFRLQVLDAGDSPIALEESLLIDPDGNHMVHTARGAKYHGTWAKLMKTLNKKGITAKAGDIFYLPSEVRNFGDIPLMVKVRFDIERIEDGRRIQIRSGQTYGGGGLGEPLPFEYFYVDGYRENPLIGDTHEWNNEGDSMIGEPDGNYMWADSAFAWSMFYSFEDVTLSGREIANVQLYGYTRQPDGSTDWDFDPYVMPWGAWCDSMCGSADWAWTGGRYYFGGPYDMPEYYIGMAMYDEAAFNSNEVFIENYCPSGPQQQIDAMRWKVEFAAITPVIAPEYLVEPHQKIDLPPVTWPSTLDHVGTYKVTATIEYTSTHVSWNAWHANSKTFSLTITP